MKILAPKLVSCSFGEIMNGLKTMPPTITEEELFKVAAAIKLPDALKKEVMQLSRGSKQTKK